MASEVISALFSAKDELSPTLQKVRSNTSQAGQQMESFSRDLREVASNSGGLDVNLQKLDQATDNVERGTRRVSRSMAEFDRTLTEVKAGTITADEGFDRMSRSLKEMSTDSTATNVALGGVGRELRDVAGASNMSGASLQTMNSQLNSTTRSSVAASSGINRLQKSTTKAAVSKTALAAATGRVNRRLSTTIPTAAGASQQLGLLAAVAAQTSFEMSSLSINIGPFNLALKNLLLQLPAILVGLGSAVAVVSALAAAFVTAGAAAAAFIAGGLIKFLDDLGQEFDEAGQALEVFMAALKDLFKEAMEPLMTEANVDLFIASINTAARVVNRFAQFFEHMRDDVLGFFGEFSGDLDEMFNALQRTFLRMEPILVRFINFLTDRAPGALEFFAERTEVILESLAMLAEGFRNLFNELLVFAGVVINAVAPVLAAVVVVLGEVFDFINRLDDRVVTLSAQFFALTLAGWKIHSMVTAVTGGFSKLNGIMKTQATQSGALARMWRSMVGVLPRLAEGEITLAQAKTLLTAAMQRHMITLQGNIRQHLKSIPIIGQRAAAIYSLIAAEITHHGVLGAIRNALIRREITSLRAAAASMAEAAATAASTAAYVAKQVAIWATIGAVKILHAVTGGLTLALAAAIFAVISLAALMWELIQSAREGAGVFAHLKNAMMFLADLIIGVLVPIFNVLWAVIKALAMPVRTLVNIFRAVYGVFSDTSDEADDAEGIFSRLASTILRVVDALGALQNLLAIVINGISTIIEFGLVKFFWALAKVVEAILVRVKEFINSLEWLQKIFDFVRDSGTTAFDAIIERIQQAMDLLNLMIETTEDVTGVDISGRFDADDVRASIRSDEEEEPEDDDFSSDPELDISFEESIEQNMDINADPDDREMLRRTVKDAMNEANALQRRRD